MLPRKINNYVGSFETGNVVRTSLSLIQPYLVYSKDQLFELKHNNSIIRNIEHEQGGRRSSHGMNKWKPAWARESSDSMSGSTGNGNFSWS